MPNSFLLFCSLLMLSERNQMSPFFQAMSPVTSTPLKAFFNKTYNGMTVSFYRHTISNVAWCSVRQTHNQEDLGPSPTRSSCAKFKSTPMFRVVKSSQLLAKIAVYLVSIGRLLHLAFLYRWCFLNNIYVDWPLTLTT